MATGEPLHSHQDFYHVLGITKGASMREICKAYKSLVMKWHPDKHPTNRSDAEKKFVAITEAYRALNNKNIEDLTKEDASISGDPKRSKDDNFFTRRPSFLSRNKSRSQTPTPSSRSPKMSQDSPPSTFSSTNVNNFNSHLNISNPTFVASTLSNGCKDPLKNRTAASLSRSVSRMPGSTPILFSQSTVRRKPPPVERKLECTLEELCNGGLKKIKLTRNVITSNGIVQEEELLQIRIKPGWKKGTKITFEEKGDEKPGFLPADITFLIDEKRHSLFKRIGDDLEIGVEIPLVQALTGCTISVPLLGGEKTTLSVNDIIYPGYEEIISGQGMPKSKEGTRGDLKIRFLVEFPTELADEQRLEAYEVLKDCC